MGSGRVGSGRVGSGRVGLGRAAHTEFSALKVNNDLFPKVLELAVEMGTEGQNIM